MVSSPENCLMSPCTINLAWSTKLTMTILHENLQLLISKSNHDSKSLRAHFFTILAKHRTEKSHEKLLRFSRYSSVDWLRPFTIDPWVPSASAEVLGRLSHGLTSDMHSTCSCQRSGLSSSSPERVTRSGPIHRGHVKRAQEEYLGRAGPLCAPRPGKAGRACRRARHSTSFLESTRRNSISVFAQSRSLCKFELIRGERKVK